jgi:hypothetical protein
MMNSTSITSVDVHLFRRDNAPVLFLLLRGAPETRFDGLWHIPTTTIAAGETPSTAALRLVTQLGLTAASLFVLDTLHCAYDPLEDRVVLTPVFAVEIQDDAPVTLPAAEDASRWNSCEQAVTLLRLPGHRDGLRRVQDDIAAARDRGAPFRVSIR